MSATSWERPVFDSVEQVYQYLVQRAPEHTMAPRLDAMYQAVDILGDPHLAAPVIHITGTNGKTSTARMIESLLLAQDLRVGRYTSPHLQRVTERISVDGHPVDDATFVRVFDEISPYLAVVDTQLAEKSQRPLTYFEVLTLLAFAIFADAPVDVVILEVGLGGVWDATNVANAAVSVVTPIDLDHTDVLGDTIEEIAHEKSGIIAPGGFLVSAAQDPDAAQVLLDKAQELEVPFCFEGVEFGLKDRTPGVGGQQVTVKGLAGTYEDVLIPLLGHYQAANAAVAVAAVEAFVGGGQTPLAQDVVGGAFAAVESPGRLELVQPSPPVVLDAAHNPHGITASAAGLLETFHPQRIYAVVGVLADKDVDGIVQALRDAYEHLDVQWWFTASESARAVPAGELAQIAVDLGVPEDCVHFEDTVPEALSQALEAARMDDSAEVQGESVVLVTGSVTVVGMARSVLAR